MTNKKFGALLLLLVLFTFGAKAQLTTSVKINEVLVTLGLSCTTTRRELLT